MNAPPDNSPALDTDRDDALELISVALPCRGVSIADFLPALCVAQPK
jgi:hypothetical protein